MSRSSGPGRRVGCGSSERNIKNEGWQKTTHMGMCNQRTWKKHGWRSWQAQNSSTTGGTICGEAERHSYGPQGHKSKSSFLLADGEALYKAEACLEICGERVSHAGSTSTKSIAGTASGTALSKPQRATSPST